MLPYVSVHVASTDESHPQLETDESYVLIVPVRLSREREREGQRGRGAERDRAVAGGSDSMNMPNKGLARPLLRPCSPICRRC